jgi:polyhydroxybutyrate depolymerase
MRPALCLFLALLAAPAAAAEPCGSPAGVCPVAGGFYRLALPDVAQGPVPALAYLHGWGGSSEGVMQNAAMREALAARGYALIAPEGIPRAQHPNRDWGVRDGSTHPRDDLAFLAAVLDDAARHGVDRSRILLAGFSRGGSMVWDVACHAPATARAYAPIAGAFWEPLPESCAGPVDLMQTHGWTDRVVPLEGRAVAGGRLVQGDAFLSLRLLRQTLGCNPQMPDTAPVDADGALWRRSWDHCPGGRLDLMLHPGGHAVPPGWLGRALDWFEARLAG